MLSIGSAAYLADKELLGTFSVNLETLPASAPDPKTAAWWAAQPDAWSAKSRTAYCRPEALRCTGSRRLADGLCLSATKANLGA